MLIENANRCSPDRTEHVVPRSLARTKNNFVDAWEGKPVNKAEIVTLNLSV